MSRTITNAMICTIEIYDADGEKSISVNHTVSETISIEQYGKQALDLSYDEATALMRALRCMLSQEDIGVCK